jgi:hypothetical protein
MKNERKKLFQEHAALFEPTPQEWAIVRMHEQRVQFKIVPARGISEGRQSRVSVLEYEINGMREQVLFKRMAVGKKLTWHEAQEFFERLFLYRQVLVDAGWNVPHIFHAEPVTINDETQIFSYEQFILGGDGDFMFANPEEPQFRKWLLLRSILDTLVQYDERMLIREDIVGQRLTRLPHGLDLKLANLVLERNGKLYFVDLFGTKELGLDGRWLTYSPKIDLLPQEELKAVCATREGAILRLYRLAEQRWSQADGIAVDVLRDGMIHLVQSAHLPSEETVFILNEMKSGFPFLDSIYKERAV